MEWIVLFITIFISEQLGGGNECHRRPRSPDRFYFQNAGMLSRQVTDGSSTSEFLRLRGVESGGRGWGTVPRDLWVPMGPQCLP